MAQVSYGTITITDTTDIERIYVEYCRSTSNQLSDGTVPGITVAWSENTPPWVNDQYIWQRSVVKKSGSTDLIYGTPVCLTGAAGATGAAGRGLTATVTKYCNYGTGEPANNYSGWTDAPPSYDSSKPNYWIKITNTYSAAPTSENIIYKDEALTKAVTDAAIANSIAQQTIEDAQGAMSQAAAAQYATEALAAKVKHYWWDSTGAHIASGINGADVTEGTASTYGFNSLVGLASMTFGYNDAKVVDLNSTTPSLDFYQPPTISGSTVTQGKKTMALTTNALKFYNPSDGTTEQAVFSNEGIRLGQQDESYINLDYHSMQLKDKEGNSYFYVSDLRDDRGEYTVTFEDYGFDNTGIRVPFLGVSDSDNVLSMSITWDNVGVETTITDDFIDIVSVDEDLNTGETLINITVWDETHTHEIAVADPIKATVTVRITGVYAKAYTAGLSRQGIISSLSFCEGYNNEASGAYSHAEGSNNCAIGPASHAEGMSTRATWRGCHAEGTATIAHGDSSHAEGNDTIAGHYSHAEGYGTKASYRSHAEGSNTIASASASHAEGSNTTASASESHAEGYYTTASGIHSHAEGYYATASGQGGHAEGSYTTASGPESHAEGDNTTASGFYSHAEGSNTIASAFYSHAEGYGTQSIINCSHAEGAYAIASAYASHAEGHKTIASGDYSHTQNIGTVATEPSQTVIGTYNAATVTGAGTTKDPYVYSDVGNYAFIIGNGDGNATAKRSNALAVDWNGQVQSQGISSLDDSYKEIYVKELTEKIKTTYRLTSSNSDSEWLQAALKLICNYYPKQTFVVFKGRIAPNSQGYFEVFIYDTSKLSNGIPQYACGTWRKWPDAFGIFKTNQYAFSYTAK